MNANSLVTRDFPVVVSVLLDSIPTPVFLKDVSGRFIGVNRAYEKVSGLTRAALVGKTVFELYPADLADKYTEADLALYASGRHQTYEVPMVTSDGQRRHMFVSKSVFRDGSGAVAGLIGTFTDLTDQRQAEHQLREINEQLEQRIADRTRALAAANALLKATLESTADGILVFDHQHEVVAYNQRFLTLWQIKAPGGDDVGRLIKAPGGDDVGRLIKAPGGDDVGRLIDGERARAGDPELLQVALSRLRDPDAFRRRVTELSGTDTEATDEVELSDGRVFERHTLPLRLAGEPPGRVWSFRDITRERHLELEMRHAQKMEAVGRLAGGVAHDFNNLLTVILSTSTIVSESLAPDHPALADVSEIRLAAERAAQLTRQLLTFSRKQLVVSRRVDVNQLLRDMLRMLTRLLGEDVSIDLRCDPALADIDADPGQLEQVIANLCVNARDAMPNGGVLVVRTRRLANADLELCVSDTGVGMSAEVRERIFEPFFTTKELGKGTGLGLSTVYGIVKQSGGTIEVHSAPGQGATFRIVLPAAASGPAVGSAALPVIAARGTGSILLVEDEAALRRILARQLRRAGYQVTEAVDGVDAEEVVARHEHPFDLLLTDVIMPRKSGIDLAQALRRSEKVRCVVFLSGFAADPERFPPGAVVVPKPFQIATLLKTIEGVLAGEGAPLLTL
jgi:PAS domain S-box-containing protein